MFESDYCCYCGEPFGTGPKVKTKDHIIPISKGGNNSKLNKADCCRDCNSRKGSMYLEQYLVKMVNKRSKLKRKKFSPLLYKLDIIIENLYFMSEYVVRMGVELFIDDFNYRQYQDERSYYLQNN